MNNLEKWTEISKGLYRYVIAAGCCYEIHIKRWYKNEPILKAESFLYIVGEWHDKKYGREYLDRDLLIHDCLQNCLNYAEKDNLENNSNLL